ncbi:MAG: hypothetical protein KCHDKBKB_01992 [Elusimicrobia bacterium]|nr:hypothetical protein [Elusimicrobiota bacterium]
MSSIWTLILLLAVGPLFSSCSAHRFFYLPNKYLYSDPVTRGMPYTLLEIPSLNGKTLSVILFQTNTPPKGTIIHCHGNFGNVSCHYMASQFLTEYGFDVLVFDYQGYGGSQGKPTPLRTIEDGIAVVRYAQDNLRDPQTGVGLFGQSLGAAVAAVVAAKEPLVKAVVLEAGFYSYRSMARATLKKSVLTWPLYPFFPLFLGSTYDPWRYVALISPRPVFFIHGKEDKIVPAWMTEKLFPFAKNPKQVWLIEGADHLECRPKMGKEYEEKIAHFFESAIKNPVEEPLVLPGGD